MNIVNWNNVKPFSKVKYVGENQTHNGLLLSYFETVDKVGAIIEVPKADDPTKVKYVICLNKRSNFYI